MICLTQAEIAVLTGFDRPSAQARELKHLGIPYKRRRDGTLVVLPTDVDPKSRSQPEPELRFG